MATQLAVLASTVPLALAVLTVPGQADTAQDGAQAGAVSADDPAESVDTDFAQTAVPSVAQKRRKAPSLQSQESIDGDPVVAFLPQTSMHEFGVLGVTWEPGKSDEDVSVQVRARVDGEWTSWEDLEIESGVQDDSGRAGTAPMWVGDADGVSVRVASESGQTPEGLRVATIDGGEGLAEPSSSKKSPTTMSASGVRKISHPSWVTRRQWGVDTRWQSSCSSPRSVPRGKGVVLHHTAGSNSYSRSEAPGIVRGVHLYHTRGRNWCDVGYNFLVDKYGRIYIGRRGPVTKQVRGAHAGNFDVNLHTSGISMLGNFHTRRPNKALENAVVRLVTWRLAFYYRGARGKIGFDGGRIKRISGHRNVYLSGIRPATATACPGRYGYRWLNRSGGLRDRVDTALDRPHLAGPMLGKYRNYRNRVDNPRSGIRKVSGHSVWYANFDNGRIYSNPRPSNVVWGTVFRKYREDTSHWGRLGFPRSDTKRVSGMPVWFSNFANGAIYSHHGNGYMVWGTIVRKYRKFGGPRSTLGPPTSDVRSVKANGPRVWYSRFRSGHIYSHSGKGGFVSYGKIDDTYQDVGGPRGRLGPPLSDIQKTSNGQKARYAHGRIVWRKGSKPKVIYD